MNVAHAVSPATPRVLIAFAVIVALLAGTAPAYGSGGKDPAKGGGDGRLELVAPAEKRVTTADEIPASQPEGVIVRFRDEVGPGAAGRGQAHKGAGGAAPRTLRFARQFDVVRTSPGMSAQALAARYARDPRVDYAEPDWTVGLTQAPDDPRFGAQWALENLGQDSGVPGADTGALDAWRFTRGSKEVVVAVIDTGVDYTHLDLANNMWSGLGWNVVGNNDDPMDTHGHGTHVAGIIAATADDGFGIAGIAPEVSIMAVKAFDGSTTSLSTLIDAIQYADANGADIINGSWSLLLNPSDPEPLALKEAIEGLSSALMVVAAGNNGLNVDQNAVYPSSWDLENMISVAASDRRDELADFSNYGSAVDIAAPGVAILSTIPGTERVLFHDGFSSLDGWVQGYAQHNDWAHSSEYFTSSPGSLGHSVDGTYANNETSVIRTASPIDLSGTDKATLSLDLFLDAEEGFDGVILEASVDASTWTYVDGWSGNFDQFIPIQQDLSAFAGQPQVWLRFVFVSDDSVTMRGVFIDDLRVTAPGAPGPSNIHEYKQGTSAAAPHVAGVAALLLSRKPGLDVPTLKSAILDSAEPVVSLAGVTATGARLDAARALAAFPDTIDIQHDAAGVAFDRWITGYSTEYSGGGYVYGRWAGTKLTATFTGSKIRWIGPKQPSYGLADVYIDGALVASGVDSYAPAGQAALETLIWESDELAPGEHTIELRPTGVAHPVGGGTFVVLDRFEVDCIEPADAGIRYDERAGTMTGTWLQYANPTYYDKTYSYSRWTNATFKLDFEGTRVSWLGPRTSNYGMADVYIDGVKVATVDQYRENLATQGWREVVWQSGELAPGAHTLEIKPLGTKNEAALDTNVVIDSFDVRP